MTLLLEMRCQHVRDEQKLGKARVFAFALVPHHCRENTYTWLACWSMRHGEHQPTVMHKHMRKSEISQAVSLTTPDA